MEIRIKDLTKIFPGDARKHIRDTIAVKDLDFVVPDGKLVGLLGPSGCGKSTTLRMVAGLEDITKGELYIDHELSNDKTPKDRDIAMVFQSYALYPHMSVYDNMAFGLKIRRMPKYEIDKRVHEAARILQIEEYLDRKPKALSGGQRQRVALGRAIVRNAKVFLMDEPLSNLDAKLRVQMRSEIIKLHEALGATTIYVTHDQTEAMTMASRIVVMKLGRIQQIGTPIEIYNHPANLFVAGFIGSPAMNFLRVKFNAKDGTATCSDGRVIKVDPSAYEGKQIPEDVILGIRPEDIVPVEAGSKDSFDIEVNVAELLGNEYYIHTDFGGADLISKFPANKLISIHDKLSVAFKGEKIHFFDPVTEVAL